MPKLLISKGRKEFVKELDREVIVIKPRSYYVSDTSKDFNTDYGVISKSALKKEGVVKSGTGKEFSLFGSSFIDDYPRLKRLPQMIPLKDIGGIIAFAGIGRNSLVLDLGTGSGGLALFLAHIAKKVVSYDINDEHIRIAEGNAKRLKIRNLKVKKKDACRGFDEKDADLVTIDIPNPWDAIKAAQKALKLGGFLVSYSPTLLQSAEFVNRIGDNPSFIHLKTVELIEREWVIKGRSVRPSSNVLVSGFLSFCRRIR